MEKISNYLVKGAFTGFIIWLLLPAIQTTLGALGGILFTILFALGVILDAQFIKKNGIKFALAVIFVAIMPVLFYKFMGKGGTNFIGYYVQQGLFFVPFLYAYYSYCKKNTFFTTQIKLVFLIALTITLLTSIYWLVEGMLRDGPIYAYARSLGYAGEGREAYLKELMLRNIGGYGMVYMNVMLLPITFYSLQVNKGKIKLAAIILFVLQIVYIFLAQYTYAMVYTLLMLVMWFFAKIIYKCSRKKLSYGYCQIISLVILISLVFVKDILLSFAIYVSDMLTMSNISFSLNSLNEALKGTLITENTRLIAYQTSIQGITQSPWLGSLINSNFQLGLHSDVLDAISAFGIIGSLVLYVLFKLLFLNNKKTLPKSSIVYYRTHLVVFIVIATFGTILYSNEIAIALVFAPVLLQGTRKA